jgi:hypothetical protein
VNRPNDELSGDSRNYLNRSFAELNRHHEQQLIRLKQEHGFRDDQLWTLWQCTWERIRHAPEEKLQNDNERELALAVRNYFDQVYKKRPLQRLIPRDGIYLL